MITEEQFKTAAELIGCEIPCVKAVYEVEASGKAYLPDGRLKILFEGHRFWKQIVREGKNPATFIRDNPEYDNVLYSSWDKKKYIGGSGEWDRMTKALEVCDKLQLSHDLALKSSSYGAFQIMGENYKACGYNSVSEMVDKYKTGGEAEQLNSFIRFVKSQRLDKYLVQKNFSGFAAGFNGSAFRKNQYDVKLSQAYQKFLI